MTQNQTQQPSSDPSTTKAAAKHGEVEADESSDDDALPRPPPMGAARNVLERGVGPKVRYAMDIGVRVEEGCPLEEGRDQAVWE